MPRRSPSSLQLTLTIITIMAAAPSLVNAQQGEWAIGARLVAVSTDESSETFVDTGTGVELDDLFTAELAATYMILDDWSIELSLSGAEISLSTEGGTDGGLDAGSAWMAPATLSVQYHIPLTAGRWRPLVGAGIGTAFFFDAEADEEIQSLGVGSLDLSNDLGYTARLGIQYEHTDRLHLGLDVRYLAFSAQSELRLGNGSLFDSIDVDLELISVGLGISYWF